MGALADPGQFIAIRTGEGGRLNISFPQPIAVLLRTVQESGEIHLTPSDIIYIHEWACHPERGNMFTLFRSIVLVRAAPGDVKSAPIPIR